MLPKHFYARADGYLKREYKESSNLRILAYFTIVPHVDTQKVAFNYASFCKDYWPLSYEEYLVDPVEEEEKKQHDYDEQKQKYYEIMRMHNPRRYKMIMKELAQKN